jgi:hypothetical protein
VYGCFLAASNKPQILRLRGCAASLRMPPR